MRVLIVSPIAKLRRLTTRALESDSYQVMNAKSGKEADDVLRHYLVDLVVIALAPSGSNGLTWYRRKRSEGFHGMILVLTEQSDTTQRITLIDAGADILMSLPFAVDELRAQVQAMARRYKWWGQSILRYGDAEIDVAARRAACAGSIVPLTEREWEVLGCLNSERGTPVPGEKIVTHLWGNTTKSASNSLKVLISRIRHKLGPGCIRTVQSQGYVLDV